VEAEAVVVAAGAIDTPALLKRSGLGNGRVGEGLRLHPAPLVGGTFPETVAAWRGLPQSVLVEEFASFMRDGRGGFMILALAGWPGLAGTLVPALGAAHRERMRMLDRTATAAVLLHDEGAGRVDIARDGRPRVRYWPDRRDRAELRRGVEALARIYLAAGAGRRAPAARRRAARGDRGGAPAGARPPLGPAAPPPHPELGAPAGELRPGTGSADGRHRPLW
jgi:long-chain-alcohol oxidase